MILEAMLPDVWHGCQHEIADDLGAFPADTLDSLVEGIQYIFVQPEVKLAHLFHNISLALYTQYNEKPRQH